MEDSKSPSQAAAPTTAPDKKFKDMNAQEKLVYLLRILVCIVTFGMVFPNAFG